MKTKLLIYGTGHFAERFVEECLDEDKVEILAFVESVKTKDRFKNREVLSLGGGAKLKYDFIIVISSYLTEIRENLVKHQIDLSKCIFTTDIHNWMCEGEIVTGFIGILKQTYMENQFKVIVENQKPSSYGVAETYDGLSFIGNYADDIIGEMIDTGKVYSFDEIDAFFDLSERFYDVNKEGYFLDCGCNILTTTIYALSRNEKLSAVAFEPVSRTWRIAKANAALNNLDQRVSVINLALSDHDSITKMMCRQYSCGGNYIVDDEMEEKEEFEEVRTTALDNWLEENLFDIDKISYLWIDVEGYEGYAINGMMRLLERRKIPLYMEFYSDLLQRSGSKEILLDCLEKVYSGYIVVKRGGVYDISQVHQIEELRNMDHMYENIFLLS